ncbi:putative golgin subfamily A member 6C [Apostichopus japonicus]|uniref:Putative golgin subfamily A member 6C n=1 Tax=Stichopus japonicus TaxID=307972 RepID=A0A2G8LFN4_STIJA|nr:putative golgin subfamily A member 6C [Apostichopus japonicus]
MNSRGSAGTHVSVAHRGALDLEHHLKTTKHQMGVRGVENSGSLSGYFIQPGSRIQSNVTAGEGTLAFHAVKHHFSYLSMDCTPGLMKQVYSDSEIARKMTCARTKTEAIVIAPHGVEMVMEAMRSISHCGVSTDASNHGSVKMFPLLIQYFDWKSGGLQTKVIDLQSLADETAAMIASYITGILEDKDILQKCVAFSGDNCNTNFGGLRRGDGNVFANLKRSVNPNLIGIGCPAHILNNCIQHGADRLSVGIDSNRVEDI